MKKFNTFSLLVIVLPLMFLCSKDSFANKEKPENIILVKANELFSDIEINKQLYQKNLDGFYKKVDKTLSPLIDFDSILKLIIGNKKYEETSDDLKYRFKVVLKNQLIKIYSKSILDYSKVKIKIIRSEEVNQYHVVTTELFMDKGKPPYQVQYIMKYTSDQWKIIEVAADGVRLVKSLRNTLMPEIDEKGIESVVKRLETESLKNLEIQSK